MITLTATSIPQLKLPEFSNSKQINFSCQVDAHNKSKSSPYDIILGSDFMAALGIDLLYSKRIIHWDGEASPMKASGILNDKNVCEAI